MMRTSSRLIIIIMYWDMCGGSGAVAEFQGGATQLEWDPVSLATPVWFAVESR